MREGWSSRCVFQTGHDRTPLWAALVFPALAGGLGWGIRGQYGHETGAMIAGVLVGLVLARLFCPRACSAPVAKAVAWGAIAMGIGGSMTYGQTLGLTHDAPLIGNWAAFSWGMLGLCIKGAIWIGFSGVFLGMGLSGTRYRMGEIALLLTAMLIACAAGIWLLNEPFDPTHQRLPLIYFSDDWRWEPGAVLKPRREVWGGLLFALATVIAYVRWAKRDPLAPRLAVWGILGGTLGFPLAQCLQAFHAWNRALFETGIWKTLDPLLNWWNFMETTFGTIMGAVLGLGLWWNQSRIGLTAAVGNTTSVEPQTTQSLPGLIEWSLLAIHVGLLVGVEFAAWSGFETLYDFGLMLTFIPLVVVAGGRWWPYLTVLPLTMLPIAGKTLAAVTRKPVNHITAWEWGTWLVVPLVISSFAAFWFARNGRRQDASTFLTWSLLLTVWLYFGLNFAVFQYPWPWSEWTPRTPNALVFTLCAAGLTWFALSQRCCGRWHGAALEAA